MSKHIIDLRPDCKVVQQICASNENVNVGARSVGLLDALTDDYIKENFKYLLDAEYQRGFEDGKAVNDKGCEGCNYADSLQGSSPCFNCSNYYQNNWTAKQTDDKIEVGDEVEWDGDKYIVTYPNKDINTGIIQDYDVMGVDGSVVDHVSKCAITKTGRHFDIASILEDMRHD